MTILVFRFGKIAVVAAVVVVVAVAAVAVAKAVVPLYFHTHSRRPHCILLSYQK